VNAGIVIMTDDDAEFKTSAELFFHGLVSC
jgi:hypothetical protein